MKPSDRAFQAAEKDPEPAAATDAMAGRNGIRRMSAVETAGIRRMRRIGDTCIIRRSKKFTGCGRAKHTLFWLQASGGKKSGPAAGGSAGEKQIRSADRREKTKKNSEKENGPGV